MNPHLAHLLDAPAPPNADVELCGSILFALVQPESHLWKGKIILYVVVAVIFKCWHDIFGEARARSRVAGGEP